MDIKLTCEDIKDIDDEQELTAIFENKEYFDMFSLKNMEQTLFPYYIRSPHLNQSKFHEICDTSKKSYIKKETNIMKYALIHGDYDIIKFILDHKFLTKSFFTKHLSLVDLFFNKVNCSMHHMNPKYINTYFRIISLNII